MKFGYWTRQCPTCGHHEHLPDKCIVGTEKFIETANYIIQITCDCDGVTRNDD